MTTALWILGLGLVLALVVWRFMIPSLAGPLAAARKQGNISPIVEAIERLGVGARPTAYNHAIKQLWDSYERSLAIELVRELAERHSSALITQYWLKQVLEVEPQLAHEKMTQEFYRLHFQPEVAASCGPVG